MIYRIEIGLKDGVPDARGRGVIHRAEGALKMNIGECRTIDYQVRLQFLDHRIELLIIGHVKIRQIDPCNGPIINSLFRNLLCEHPFTANDQQFLF